MSQAPSPLLWQVESSPGPPTQQPGAVLLLRTLGLLQVMSLEGLLAPLGTPLLPTWLPKPC